MHTIRAFRLNSTLIFVAGILAGMSLFIVYQAVQEHAAKIVSINALLGVNECPSWTQMHNTQVFGANSNSAKSLEACKQACVSHTGCDGFDWSPDEMDGARCWLSGAWTSGSNNGSAPGVTHYTLVECQKVPRLEVDDVKSSSPECLTSWKWTPLPNTKRQNGRANSSPSVSDCKSSCITAPNCTGFDWSPDSPIGQRCWLSGDWSAEWVNGTAEGVTHFVFSQGCEGESIPRTANRHTRSSTECTLWMSSEKTKTIGSRPDNALTVDQCQKSCLANIGCNGFDWNSESPDGPRCWLSGSWIAGWINGSADGITHYFLDKKCL